MYCYRSCYCCCCCSCYCQGLALSCVCAPMVSRSHVFILSSSHALMLSFSRAIMMLSVCRLYRKYQRIIVRNQNASPHNIADIFAIKMHPPSTSPTSARSAQVRPSHDVMLSRLRALEPSCSRTLMLSCTHALGLSSRDAVLLSCLQALV